MRKKTPPRTACVRGTFVEAVTTQSLVAFRTLYRIGKDAVSDSFSCPFTVLARRAVVNTREDARIRDFVAMHR